MRACSRVCVPVCACDCVSVCENGRTVVVCSSRRVSSGCAGCSRRVSSVVNLKSSCKSSSSSSSSSSCVPVPVLAVAAVVVIEVAAAVVAEAAV